MHRRILIIDDRDDLATALEEVLTGMGHSVALLETRNDAPNLAGLERFDLVITDLDVEASQIQTLNGGKESHEPASEHIKAFKVSAANFRCDKFDETELKEIVATVLDHKIRHVDNADGVQDLHEHIEFEVPSALSLMHIVLEYLMKRVEKLGVVKSEQSNLFVALDEAFVNAVKHGNKFDVS